MDVLIKGGLVVNSWGRFKGDVLISDGKVSALGVDLSARGAEVIDANGMLVLPGFVDEHVHFREPGMEYKEGFLNGSLAAAVGGVTTVADMPNNLPPIKGLREFKEKVKLLRSKSYVDYALYCMLTDEVEGEVDDVLEEGAIGFKVYMTPSVGMESPPSQATILKVLEASAEKGFVVAFHAEDHELVSYYTSLAKGAYGNSPEAHSHARPMICEWVAVAKVLQYCKYTKGKVLISHVSSAGALSMIEDAKMKGISVTCETCPHYLYFCDEDYAKHGTVLKVNPPIRSRSDVNALWSGIERGIVDCVASDHAPHTAEEKLRDVWNASPGISGVELLGPLTLDAALRERLTLEKVAELISANPAKVLGLYPKKGSIEVGSDADVVIVDPNGTTRVERANLRSKARLTPYEGMVLRGSIKRVILRGETVVEEGKVVGSPRGVLLTHASRNDK